MNVYNEEAEGPKVTMILVLDKQEAQELIEMTRIAANLNMRKRRWQKMADALFDKLCAY